LVNSITLDAGGSVCRTTPKSICERYRTADTGPLTPTPLPYLLVGVLGLTLFGTSANILAFNQADNVLHLAIAALGIGVVAYATSRRAQPAKA
jgi:hypothetical protein